MTTFSSTELLTYANLQIAAEALYGKLKSPAGKPDTLMTSEDIDKINEKLFIENSYEGHLTQGNNHTSKFSKVQAEQFTKDWQVVQHINNTSSGFSGTLFKNVHTNELVFSFRSTEFLEDYIHDNISTNTHEIADKGWAFGQISDMEQWFNTLATDLKLKNEDGTYNQQITVTGYSLGGHLATAFHILHQNDNLIKNTFTFNGAGVGDVGGLFDKVTSKEELYSYC